MNRSKQTKQTQGNLTPSLRGAFSLGVACAILSLFAFSIANADEEKHAAGPAVTPSINANISSTISIDRSTYDFGSIEAGTILKHSFIITNKGTAPLHLYKAWASCGCTAARLEKKEIEPGEATALDVTIDTAMKQDSITKTVYIDSDDRKTPRISVSCKLIALDPHQGMTAEGGAKIFSDAHCASCHVAQGEGKFGRELFNADCAMCHGPKAEGAVGPALFGPYHNPQFTKLIKETTECGSKTHRSMPGFLASHGGPLNQQQIDSIIDYLKSLSQARGL